MTRKKLTAIMREIDALRQSQPKARTLAALAKKLGRKKFDRGKEPTYESIMLPELRPLSIPNHGGKDMPNGTKNSILTALEDDVFAWEELLSATATQVAKLVKK